MRKTIYLSKAKYIAEATITKFRKKTFQKGLAKELTSIGMQRFHNEHKTSGIKAYPKSRPKVSLKRLAIITIKEPS